MHKVKVLLRKRSLVYAAAGDTVLEVARKMGSAKIGAIPILDGSRLMGIFSERDLMTRVVIPGRAPSEVFVQEVMTGDVITAEGDDTRSECIAKMREAGCRHLPVLEDGDVVAMLSMRDLLRDAIAEQGEEIQSLRAYLHQQPLA
jgi:CBS domain-containing protein